MGKLVEMPKFDMSMTEGTITKWLFKEGDMINEGDDIFEAETGKASNVADSLYTGKLLKIYFGEGETVPVLTPVAFIGNDGDEIPAKPEIAQTGDSAEDKPSTTAAPAAAKPEKSEIKAKSDLDTSSYEFDLVVIGAGPGGYVAAIRAAQLGARVAIIEKDTVGGTCLNRGCIPTKALYSSASVYEKIKNAAEYGLKAELYGFDWPRIMSRKDGIVKQLTGGVAALLKKNGVESIKGSAEITDDHTVTVGDRKVTAGYILIATGTEPVHVLKNVAADVKIMTTDDILSLEKLPESMAIIGGGVIGVEIANILSSFDVKVTIIELMPSIIPMVDSEISALLAKELEAKGVKILTGVKTDAVEVKGGKNIIRLENGDTVECDGILEAVGRKPVDGAFASLNLERTAKGAVVVDSVMRTSRDNIYAIGDVTGGYMLAHEASAEGEIAVEHMFLSKEPEENILIPSCIFTAPEIAFVGLTEEKAKAAGNRVKTFKFPFAANGKALTLGESKGFVKVVADETYGEILGVHIVGPEASSLIHEAVMAMNLEATAEFAGRIVHAHPTLAESLKEAFMGVSTGAIHY